MKLNYVITLITIMSAFLLPQTSAWGLENGRAQSLDQAYLAQWFSIDSANALEPNLKSMTADEFGERAEISFHSDDGQAVNGYIAFPSVRTESPKLALALHPMGSDQRFWRPEASALKAHKISEQLRRQGYIVLSLDARKHGKRSQSGFGPKELLQRARSMEPRLYIDTIIGTVRDYRLLLNWAIEQYQASEVLAVGYSMGAQMSLLLASYEPTISTIIAMVPPYVNVDISPVAPRIHVKRISNAKVLWLAGEKDPYSDRGQTTETFAKIGSQRKTLKWFDAGHRLPSEYLDIVMKYLNEEGES